MGLTTTELADKLCLSKGRISQLVKSGKLIEGHDFTGSGRQRRFNLNNCIDTLRHTLDVSQAVANGAKTTAQIDAIASGPRKTSTQMPQDEDLPKQATARLNEIRVKRAELDLRRSLREEQVEEGRWVDVDEVRRATQKLIGQEVAETEAWLKDAARLIADKNGLNFKEVRADLRASWRKQRGDRADALKKAAADAEMSEREQQGNF